MVGVATVFSERPVSRGLAKALDPTRLSRRHGDGELMVVIAMLIAATRYLTFVGGGAATAETLRHTAGQVERGEFPEPTHRAGNA